MTTLTKVGLEDHGQAMSYDDFASADFEEGYRYELIDGRLYVAPIANAPEDRNRSWIYDSLRTYCRSHPDVINLVSFGPRVFVPGRRRTTCPEPDVAAYADYPIDLPFDAVHWSEVSPILVVEVLYDSDPYKDLVRNVALYLQVPSIREYWIVDARDNANEPTLIVRRRQGRRWVKREYYFGEKYETKLLPGFKLRIDPRR